MKSLIFLSLFITSFSVSAKIWQVSNVTPTAHFQTLTLAHSQAQPGDTLFVEGSGTAYEGITLTKKLVLIGPGYFLTENPNTHFNKKPALIKSNVVYEKGSAGSELIGFDFRYHGADVIIWENQITIKRNRLDVISFHNNSSSSCSDILIIQNYIEGEIIGRNPYSYSVLELNRIIVSNNFINALNLEQNSQQSSMSGIFENNIIFGIFLCYNSIVRNNIHLKNSTTPSSPGYFLLEKKRFNNVYNNLFALGTPTDLVNHQVGTNNQFLINKAALFLGLTNNSTDGQWQLLINSPASKKGSDGSDCGMFGGATPYQLSGQPPLPVVYEIIGPDLETGKVTVKARAIN